MITPPVHAGNTAAPGHPEFRRFPQGFTLPGEPGPDVGFLIDGMTQCLCPVAATSAGGSSVMAAKESSSGFPGACHRIRSAGGEIRITLPAWRHEHERVADPARARPQAASSGAIVCTVHAPFAWTSPPAVFHPRAKAVEFGHETDGYPTRLWANRWDSGRKVAELPTAGNRKSSRFPDRPRPASVDTRPAGWQSGGFPTPSWQPRGFLTPR